MNKIYLSIKKEKIIGITWWLKYIYFKRKWLKTPIIRLIQGNLKLKKQYKFSDRKWPEF